MTVATAVAFSYAAPVIETGPMGERGLRRGCNRRLGSPMLCLAQPIKEGLQGLSKPGNGRLRRVGALGIE